MEDRAMHIENVISSSLEQPPMPQEAMHVRPISDLVTAKRNLVTNTIAYDKRAAHLLAVASAWAYSDADTLSNVLARQGVPNQCLRFRVSNNALFVDANAFLIQSEDGRLAILCFCGTDPANIMTWMTDMSVHVDPFYSHGHVHGGFYRNVRALWRNIAESIDLALQGINIYTRGKPTDGAQSEDGRAKKSLNKLEGLYITGHSLGGAMAALSAAIMYNSSKYEHLKDALRAVYTFGQPMIGDSMFADKCEHDFGRIVFRHVYGNDIVPRMPPLIAGRFKHCGQEYHSKSDGWELKRTAVYQAPSAILGNAFGIAAWMKQQVPMLGELKLKLPYSWDDHSPLHYVRCSQIVEPGSEFD
jgi:hypothetical protein